MLRRIIILQKIKNNWSKVYPNHSKAWRLSAQRANWAMNNSDWSKRLLPRQEIRLRYKMTMEWTLIMRNTRWKQVRKDRPKKNMRVRTMVPSTPVKMHKICNIKTGSKRMLRRDQTILLQLFRNWNYRILVDWSMLKVNLWM